MNALSRRYVLLFAVSLPALGWTQTAPAAKPVKVEGLVFAGETTVGGSPLVLNGVGLRAVAWVKGYAAGLYLANRQRLSVRR